jgi:septal ring factor EnvC (AmiA/AmiB activator)
MGRAHRRGLALIALSLLCAATGLRGADTEKELAAVRARIEALRTELERATRQRDAETARLRDTEVRRATSSRRLEALRGERRASEAELEKLGRERAEHERGLAAERGRLEQTLRAAYFSGGQERLKLLLGEDDPGELSRMMVYQSYLAGTRARRLEAVRAHVAEIARLEQASAEETARLRALEQEQAKEVAALEAARVEREAAIASLDKRIREQSSSIREMEARERTLADLLEQLRQALSDFPVQGEKPFTALRGRLTWPVGGKLLADFGEVRAGARLRWNGVLLGAERGAAVHAIANGRVAFADWLPGLGLLVIVEHGGGYMSLYGHNETLRKSAGDWVRPGDVIATVGDSGGQARPALYFEIRRGKKPENPHPWFSKKLARR